MRPVSAQWPALLAAGHHRLATKAAVLAPDGTATPVDIDDGAVTLDATTASRGRCDLSVIVDRPEVIPSTPEDLLAPYGNELQVWRGIADEFISLGVFRLNIVNVLDTGDSLAVRVSAPDRSQIVIDARFEEPYQLASGTDAAQAIAATLELGYPGIDTSGFPAAIADTQTLTADTGDDRWEFCQQIARGVGYELYFDGDGLPQLRPIPFGGVPVAFLEEGEGGVLLSVEREWSREGAFNRVVAVGENTETETVIARGVATDLNPLSPTYYNGPFGRVPRFYSSPFIATTQQAEAAAEGILAKELGTSQKINFGTVVNPALEPSDVVRVTRERAGIVEEDNVIDSVTIPLGAEGVMDGTTRAVQVFG